jgi:signal peptidase II
VHRLPAIQRAKEQTVTSPPRSPRWPWLLGALTLAADQLTKLLAVSAQWHGVPLLPPIVYLTYVQNTGAAFGLFKGRQAVFIVMAVLIIAWIAWELRVNRPSGRLVQWSYGLMLGGAAGNLIDRVRFGYVIDFLDLRVWPVFNIGDSAITVGVSLLLLHALRRRHRTPDT